MVLVTLGVFRVVFHKKIGPLMLNGPLNDPMLPFWFDSLTL